MNLTKIHELKLKTLSPVHIGNGERIPALFFGKTPQNEFGRLKEKRFFEIFEKNMGILRKELEKGRKIPMLNDAIRNIRLSKTDFLYPCQLSVVSNLKGEVSEFVHHPNGEFYIPGSSLKGALRIALLFKILEPHKDDINREVEKKLKEVFRRGQLARFMKDYVDNYLRNSRDSKLKINSDYMRAFRFFDSEPVNTKPKIVEMKLFKLNTYKNGYVLNLDNRGGFMEVLDEQVEAKFTVSIDFEIIDRLEKEFGKFNPSLPRNLNGLVRIADEFYRKVVEEEIKFLKSYDRSALAGKVLAFYNKLLSSSGKVIHLGYGGGSNAMSLFLLLRDDLKKKIRNIIKNHGNMPAPLSRRYVVLEEYNSIKAAAPFGWCEVEI